MIATIWHDFLYQPLLNLLIWIYNNHTDFNLGLAVVYLTVLLRLVLLPFTFVSERDKIRWERLNQEVKKIKEEYKKDPVLMKEAVRETLKKHHIRPWSKTIVLAIQLLALILLYQVFLGGINNKFSDLYQAVPSPDFVNLIFLPIKAINFSGFDLSQKYELFLPILVGIILYVEIYLNQRKRSETLTNSDVAYRFFFPLFSFAILYWLPAVKSIFILTSMFFTIFVSLISWPIRISLAKVNQNQVKN